MNKASGAAGAGPEILLFIPFQTLPEDNKEILDCLSPVSGIEPGDLRYKLTGRGIARLTPDPSPEIIKDCLSQMQDMGIAAAAIPSASLKGRLSLPAARKVEISESSVVFLDNRDNPVLSVDKSTRLLAIAADLSGSAIEKPHLALHFNATVKEKTFEQSLRKISTGRPAAVFLALGKNSTSGVFVDHKRFFYPSMEEHMSHSAAVNFRNLVDIVTKRAGSVITDHMFGTARLPGTVPDFKSGQRDILAALHLYTRYVLAAARAGLIGGPLSKSAEKGPGAVAASFTAKSKAAGGPADAESSSTQDHLKPKPPPDRLNTGFFARFGSSLQEGLLGAAFGLIAFFWFFFNTKSLDNPVFWKTAAGIGFICAGVLIFSYSLVLVHYRRMVENTPTSRVRSVAMGMAELEGRARQYYDLRSPHTKTKCIYYQCTYMRRIRTSKGTKWKIEKILRSGRLPFYLQDPTGHILVRPGGALMLINKNRQEFWGGQSMWLAGDLQDRNRKICETVIAEGARVYVLGSAGTERVGPAFKQRLVERLRALKSDPEALGAYDTNQDGRIDEYEWEAARTDMETRLYAESLMNKAGAGHRPVIAKSKSGMMPFIIADSEDAIIKKLTLRTCLFLPGGLLIAGLGLHLLLQAHQT